MCKKLITGIAAGSLAFVLWHAGAAAQPEVWEQHIRASSTAYQRGDFAQAIKHVEAALKAAETSGRDSIRVADTLTILADIDKNQGKFREAEPLYKQSLDIAEKVLGAEHPDLADKLQNLAELNRNQEKFAQAEALYRRALAIDEGALGSAHLHVALSRHNLALFYQSLSKYAEAEPLFKQSLTVWEQALGSEHPVLAKGLENYAVLLRESGQVAAAEKVETRANDIRLNYARRDRERLRPYRFSR